MLGSNLGLCLFKMWLANGSGGNDTSAPIHCKKRFTSFPSPAGMLLTKLPLGRNNSVMNSLFLPRESLVVTSRLGTGNSRTFFLRCRQDGSNLQGAAWLRGCGMAQFVACRAGAAVRRPRVRISARHPSGDPLPELAAMKKLERNSANVMNECVWMNLYESAVNIEENCYFK